MPRIALVTLVNDRAQFAACEASLRRDLPQLPAWVVVEPNARGWNAAQGLNHGIDQVDADWVVCVHQDVLFPAGTWRRLVEALAGAAADVALAGPVGCDRAGRYRGHIVDPNGHCYWPALPSEVLTLDEVLIAVRKDTGLRFDPAVPGFHCYGTALCLEADRRGLRALAVDAPIVHLSTGRIDEHYERAARWLMETWGPRHGHVLPTPAMLLQDDDRAGLLRRLLFRWRRRRDRLARNTNRCPDGDCAARREAAAVVRERSG
mgnify:CR=1 FL=1